MALSRHFQHLRTNFKYEQQPELALFVPEKPDTTNKYELRRNRAAIKVPKRLAQHIVKNKDTLKAYATYFELKPLYYSSVIKNARSHYPELAQYLQICENTLRKRISQMLKHDLAWWDGCHLRLIAYRKVVKKHGLTNFYQKTQNIGSTDLILRTMSLKENFDDQAYISTKKIKNNALKQDLLEDELHRINILSKNYVDASIPQMVKRINADQLLKSTGKKKIRAFEKIVNLRMDILKKQSQERTYFNLINGIKCSKTPNPTTTLSCQSVAKMYGCQSASSGHYWEQQLAQNNLIHIEKTFIEVKKNSPLVWDKFVAGENNGIWKTKHISKKTKTPYYFLTLANKLFIINNPQNPLFM